jgi:hypothetical protein
MDERSEIRAETERLVRKLVQVKRDPECVRQILVMEMYIRDI